MPTKDGFHTTKEMVLIFLCVAAAAFIIAAAGSAVKGGWLVIPVTTFLTTTGAYLITRKSDNKTKMKAIIAWAIIGLVISIFWYWKS